MTFYINALALRRVMFVLKNFKCDTKQKSKRIRCKINFIVETVYEIKFYSISLRLCSLQLFLRSYFYFVKANDIKWST